MAHQPWNIDCVQIGGLCPTGYAFIHIQEELRSGGVGLLFKESLGIQCKNSEWNTSFQSFEISFGGFKSPKMIRLLSIYHLPSSVPFSTFYREFYLLLDQMASTSVSFLSSLILIYTLTVRFQNYLHICLLLKNET